MSAATPTFSATAISDLRERTEYEAWLLEAAYEIANDPLGATGFELIEYPPDGARRRHIVMGAGRAVIGDWRPKFLEVGAPLIFVTSFKLLDMLIEWVLAQNGQPSTYKFVQKIKALKGPILFPPVIENRTWLRERVLALYEHLEPLRGTIVHERHFATTKGTLTVSSSKGGQLGAKVLIDAATLRNLALILVSLLRYVEGAWSIGAFSEKRLRHTFDQMTHLHKLSSLGQVAPTWINARVFALDTDPISVDLRTITQDVAQARPDNDVMLAVELIVVDPNASRAAAYNIPPTQVQAWTNVSTLSRTDLASYATAVPEGVDVEATARALCEESDTCAEDANDVQ
jgi:hypothetical protein